MRTEFNKELRRRQYLILRDLPFFFSSPLRLIFQRLREYYSSLYIYKTPSVVASPCSAV